MKYRSKKDLAWIASWYGGILLFFLSGISYLTTSGSSWIGWLLLCFGVASGIFILATSFPMYYEITPTILHVRTGLIHREIGLNSIQLVFPDSPSHGIPAWSFDRLRVDYRIEGRNAWMHVFPKDKLRFMHGLAEDAEELEVKDGCVVRRHTPTSIWESSQ